MSPSQKRKRRSLWLVIRIREAFECCRKGGMDRMPFAANEWALEFETLAGRAARSERVQRPKRREERGEYDRHHAGDIQWTSNHPAAFTTPKPEGKL